MQCDLRMWSRSVRKRPDTRFCHRGPVWRSVNRPTVHQTRWLCCLSSRCTHSPLQVNKLQKWLCNFHFMVEKKKITTMFLWLKCQIQDKLQRGRNCQSSRHTDQIEHIFTCTLLSQFTVRICQVWIKICKFKLFFFKEKKHHKHWIVKYVQYDNASRWNISINCQLELGCLQGGGYKMELPWPNQ